MLRSLTHRFFRSFGYDIRRYVSECGIGTPMLDLAVAAFTTDGAVPYMVQVGANDGVTDDPLRHLILKHSLPGLLIEPMPEAFAQLRQNYAGQPRLAFENCALWSEDGERDFFRIRPAAYANPRVKGMAGISREVLLGASRHLPNLARNVETMRVRTLSPASIFAKHAVSRIDLLVVDTEGFDDIIIKLILDFGMAPAIIYFEHVHLRPDRQDAFALFLDRRGYRFARTRTDTLALLSAASDAGRNGSCGQPTVD